jgi:hypothetical protein
MATVKRRRDGTEIADKGDGVYETLVRRMETVQKQKAEVEELLEDIRRRELLLHADMKA